MTYRQKLKSFVENHVFTRIVTSLIVINAIVLGLETDKDLMATHGQTLIAIDHVILWIFVGELLLRLGAYGLRFFRDPWNIFDTVIVAISLIPAQEAFSVLRAARILRVLRLISMFPRLRRVVEGLITAIPGIGSIAAILTIVFYVFAVMATKLYGAAYPEWFGSLKISLFTLFQIMTLEGWADMVRQIMQTHPFAWIFFIVYILSSTFIVLNLFIAVIVDAMQKQHQDEHDAEQHQDMEKIERELSEIRKKLDEIAAR